MSTIYFHIGQYKTGSTSIQRFLVKNRTLFRNAGYIYPCKSPVEIHQFTMRLFECFFQGKDPYKCEDTKALLTKIQKLSLDLIYSSEHLASFTQHLDQLNRIFYSKNYKIIFYIRRADYYFESLYNQLLRDCIITNKTPAEDFIAFFNATEADRYTVVEKWSEAFGKKNVSIIPFREEQSPTEIYTSFCKAINLTLTNDFVLPSNQRNISLPFKLTPLLKEINHKFHLQPEKADYIKLAITEAYHRKGFDSFEKNSRFLSPKQREEIIKISKPFDDKIAQKYFQKDHLFDYTIKKENNQKYSNFFTQNEVKELVINTLDLLYDEHNK